MTCFSPVTVVNIALCNDSTVMILIDPVGLYFTKSSEVTIFIRTVCLQDIHDLLMVYVFLHTETLSNGSATQEC